MSEEKTEMPVEEQAQTEELAAVPAEGEAPEANIANELQELGRQLTAATKAVLESPEAQELKTQLQKGLESLEKSVSKVTTQVRETEVGQKVESGVGDVAATVKERRIVETVAESVTAALRAVNKSLGQVVEKAQAHAEEAKAKKPVPQQIEIVDTEEEVAEEPEAGEE